MPTSSNAAALETATLCLINEERSSRAIKPLRASKHLGRAARKFSRSMVREGFFDHVSPGGSTLTNRIRRGTRYLHGARRYSLAENIAWGSGRYATPHETVEGWMESSGHRKNMLSRRYHHIGVGVAIGAPELDMGQPAATYTTDFGYRTTGRSTRSKKRSRARR